MSVDDKVAPEIGSMVKVHVQHDHQIRPAVVTRVYPEETLRGQAVDLEIFGLEPGDPARRPKQVMKSGKPGEFGGWWWGHEEEKVLVPAPPEEETAPPSEDAAGDYLDHERQ